MWIIHIYELCCFDSFCLSGKSWSQRYKVCHLSAYLFIHPSNLAPLSSHKFDRSQDILHPLLHPLGKHLVWAWKSKSEVSEKHYLLKHGFLTGKRRVQLLGKHWHNLLRAIWDPSALKSQSEFSLKKCLKISVSSLVVASCFQTRVQTQKSSLAKAFSTFPYLQPTR